MSFTGARLSFMMTEGRPAQKPKSELRQWRAWLAVFGGALVHLTLGTVYTFGNMSPYITSYIREHGKQKDITYGTSVWIYACAIIGQGSSMYFGGILGRLIGPRWTTLIGSLLSSGGVALSYFAIVNFYALCATYGLMFGLGVGLAYVNPLSCAMRWMPSHRGFANGIVVAGFGAGALIFDQVQTKYINPHNLKVSVHEHGSCGKEESYFGGKDPKQAELLERVPHCFLLLGLIYACMQVVGCLLLSNPPEAEPEAQGYKKVSAEEPIGDVMESSESTSGALDSAPRYQIDLNCGCSRVKLGPIHRPATSRSFFGEDLSPKRAVPTWLFAILWLTFLVNGQAVTYVATLYKAFGQSLHIGSDHFLANVGTIASPFNAFARIFWGFIADRYSYRTAMFSMTSICTVLLCSFYFTPHLGPAAYAIWVALLFFCLGGNFSLFPFATATTFGDKFVGPNYGMIFSSQVISGVLGASLTSNLICKLGYAGLIPLCAGFQFIGVLLALVFPYPSQVAASQQRTVQQ
eukprot:scpid48894/ scgid7074/ Oxalate:formate antiporter; Oxalate:formate antiport protein; Oxalate:formate exchange protein